MLEKKHAALEYADRGWRVFPVWPNQKNPIHDGGHNNATTEAAQIELWWDEHPDANIGLNLIGSGLVAVDVDIYKPDCQWEEFKGDRPFAPECIHQSARGGFHYIFKAEEGQTFSNPCTGVDIKHNGYIVLAPSTFEGKPYKWVQDDEPTVVPDWLVGCAGNQKPTSGQAIVRDWTGNVVDGREAYWRDLTLAKITEFREQNGADPTILEVWEECWPVFEAKTYADEKWRSPKGQETLQRRIKSTLKRIESGKVKPKIIEEEGPSFVLDNKGRIISNHHNVSEVLKWHEGWKDTLAYDEFTGLRMLMKPLPNRTTPKSSFKPRKLEDFDYIHAIEWFNRNNFPRVSKNTVMDAIDAACHSTIISPVRHFLEDLAWDGVSRLNAWLINYCGAENTHFNREVGKLWMISAVARALQPGCKADCALVLESEQGAGKSTVFETLASAGWFYDGLSDLHSKDAAAGLKGKWIIELPELSAMRRSDVEAVKAFLSRTTERYRPAYGRSEVVEPRRCVFGGTTNRQDYLTDDTGGRRFWPVSVGAINLEQLRQDRDQLWAEAVHLYKQPDARWWLSAEDEKTAFEVVMSRTAEDPWEAHVISELRGRSEICTRVILGTLGLEQSRQTKADAMRVSGIIIRAGWRKDGKYSAGDLKGLSRYVAPDRGRTS